MNTRKLLIKLSRYYPHSLAESFDHVGLMEGKLPYETQKILLCLDFDDEVYPFAIKENPDLIITHHPFLFGTKMAVLNSDPVKKALYDKMLLTNMPIVSYHTNFDNGNPGMNDELALRLGLLNVKTLETEHMARGGFLPCPMEIHEFARYAKEKLGVAYGLLIPAGKQTIRSVAIIGGGGARSYLNAMNEGYDIFVSGDAPHHVRREIILNHYSYLDLPHEIEHAFMGRMEKTLKVIDPTLTIIKVDHEKLPEVI